MYKPSERVVISQSYVLCWIRDAVVVRKKNMYLISIQVNKLKSVTIVTRTDNSIKADYIGTQSLHALGILLKD